MRATTWTTAELEALAAERAAKADRLCRGLSELSRRLTGRPDPEPEIPNREDDFSRFGTAGEATAAAAPTEAVVQGQDAAWYRLGLRIARWTAMTPLQRRAYANALGLGLVLPCTVNARTLGA